MEQQDKVEFLLYPHNLIFNDMRYLTFPYLPRYSRVVAVSLEGLERSNSRQFWERKHPSSILFKNGTETDSDRIKQSIRVATMDEKFFNESTLKNENEISSIIKNLDIALKSLTNEGLELILKACCFLPMDEISSRILNKALIYKVTVSQRIFEGQIESVDENIERRQSWIKEADNYYCSIPRMVEDLYRALVDENKTLYSILVKHLGLVFDTKGNLNIDSLFIYRQLLKATSRIWFILCHQHFLEIQFFGNNYALWNILQSSKFDPVKRRRWLCNEKISYQNISVNSIHHFRETTTE